MSVWLVLRTFSPSGSEIIPRMCSCSASFDAVFPLLPSTGARCFLILLPSHTALRFWWPMWHLQSGYCCAPTIHRRCTLQSGLCWRKVIWTRWLQSHTRQHGDSGCKCSGMQWVNCSLLFPPHPVTAGENGTAWEIVVNCHELSHLSHPRFLDPFFSFLGHNAGRGMTGMPQPRRMQRTSQLSWACRLVPWISFVRCCSWIRRSDRAVWTGRRAIGPNPMAPYGSSPPYPMISWPFWGISMYFRDFHGMSVCRYVGVSLSFLIFLEPTWTMIRDVPILLQLACWGVLGTPMAGGTLRATAHPQTAGRGSHLFGRCFLVTWQLMINYD